MTKENSKRTYGSKKKQYLGKPKKKNLIEEPLSKTNEFIHPDNLNNTALARQQLWTITILEIVLFRRQFPSFLNSDEIKMKTHWKIMIEEECSRLETLLQRAEKIGELKNIEEIEFRAGNGGELLSEAFLEDNNSKPIDFYFLLTHKGPGFNPVQLLKILRDQEYPIPIGLIDAMQEKRFEDAGKLLWGLHQNMIHWYCSEKKTGLSNFPFSIEDNQRLIQQANRPSSPDPSGLYKPSNARREARKLDTQARYKGWQKAYRELKRKHPGKKDNWCALQIAKMDISQGRKSETIRKEMKK